MGLMESPKSKRKFPKGEVSQLKCEHLGSRKGHCRGHGQRKGHNIDFPASWEQTGRTKECGVVIYFDSTHLKNFISR